MQRDFAETGFAGQELGQPGGPTARPRQAGATHGRARRKAGGDALEFAQISRERVSGRASALGSSRDQRPVRVVVGFIAQLIGGDGTRRHRPRYGAGQSGCHGGPRLRQIEPQHEGRAGQPLEGLQARQQLAVEVEHDPERVGPRRRVPPCRVRRAAARAHAGCPSPGGQARQQAGHGAVGSADRDADQRVHVEVLERDAQEGRRDQWSATVRLDRRPHQRRVRVGRVVVALDQEGGRERTRPAPRSRRRRRHGGGGGSRPGA